MSIFILLLVTYEGKIIMILMIIIISTTTFIVLSSWQSHCTSSVGWRNDYSMAPGGCQPLDQSNQLESQSRRSLRRQPVNRIHHCHLDREGDAHFTIPWKVEGWVDLGGCHIPRWFTRLQMVVIHLSTNWAQHRVASLICPTMIPLHQTAT